MSNIQPIEGGLPYTFEPYKDEQEWLALRKTGIGGSDAAIVAGLSGFETALGLYLVKTGDIEPDSDSEQNEAMRWGHLLEDVVAEEYSRRTGNKIRRNNRMLRSKQWPFMLANLDREIVGEPRLLECKTARFGGPEWGPSGTDQVPEAYLIQCQHYLAVTNKREIDLAVLIGGQDFRVYRIARNESLINSLILIEEQFWNQVKQGVPPEPDYSHPKTGELLAKLYPGTDGSVIRFPEETAHWLHVERECARLIKQYSDARDAAINHIKALMGNAAIGIMPDGSGYTRKTVKRKAYEVAAVEYVDFRFTKDAEKKAGGK